MKPDGGEIFVSNFGSDSVSEISTWTNEVGGTYTIGSRPVRGLVSRDNGTLWVANFGADSIALYSIDDGRLAWSVRAGSAPDALAFSEDEHILLGCGRSFRGCCGHSDRRNCFSCALYDASCRQLTQFDCGEGDSENAVIFAKKICGLVGGFFPLFLLGFLRGFGKSACLGWFFAGKNVVECVVNVGS